MGIRRYINIVESIGIDGSVDPEDIINFNNLLKFAKQTATIGFGVFSDFKPALKSIMTKGAKFVPPQPRTHYGFQTIINCLLTPSNGWLIKMNDETQLLNHVKYMPENEQDMLLKRYREGHSMYMFDRDAVDMHDLEKCCKGVETVTRPSKDEIYGSSDPLSSPHNHSLSPYKED